MVRKLYKSSKDKVLAGVCGGVAEYFDIDPTLVRLAWVLISLTWGIGIIGYIICAIIIPERPSILNANSTIEGELNENEQNNFNAKNNDKNRLVFGGILIIIGSVLLIKKFFYWLDFENIWAMLLVLTGIYLLVKKSD